MDWNWINTTPFQSSHDPFGCVGSGLLLSNVSNHVFDRARIAFKLSIPSVIILSQSIELICNVIVCFSLSRSYPPTPSLSLSLSLVSSLSLSLFSLSFSAPNFQSSPISSSQTAFHFSTYPLSSIHLLCSPLPFTIPALPHSPSLPLPSHLSLSVFLFSPLSYISLYLSSFSKDIIGRFVFSPPLSCTIIKQI